MWFVVAYFPSCDLFVFGTKPPGLMSDVESLCHDANVVNNAHNYVYSGLSPCHASDLDWVLRN